MEGARSLMNLLDNIANCLHRRILKVRWRMLHERFRYPERPRRVSILKVLLVGVNTVLHVTNRIVYRDQFAYMNALEKIIKISKKRSIWTRTKEEER